MVPIFLFLDALFTAAAAFSFFTAVGFS